jgi:hypothetical protein
VRKVFSSQRIENVEGVAELLREAGIEVRITDGRSYRGNRRGNFSYSDRSGPTPAVWVVRSDQQVAARELLRDAGLIDTTRGQGSYVSSTFRFRSEQEPVGRTPAQKRMFRLKVGLILVAVAVAGVAMMRGVDLPAPGAAPVRELAEPPFDGTIAATLFPVAQAVFTSELGEVDTPVACLGVDNTDASIRLIETLQRDRLDLVQASACVEVADEDRGSFQRSSGREAMIVRVGAFRPSAPDRGTIEYSAYHHRMWASYKTLEVARVDGQWQIVDVVRHVRSRGIGF